ncbi:phosphoglycerate mutase-like protein [Pleurotus eryngii]|uniref:Phosphoglycerate mutase-like protein n=1 Tax=Pleurotus eryngii TaxID=5323 RepID=A0A9P6AA87_PLEER|nr:phosphoglycerate mutase-like protein [Pleurotus eryngii]
MNHAIQIDDKVMQQTMQPLVGDDPDATIERLKTEVAGGAVAGNPSEFGEIVFVFLRQAFKMDALMQILHITEFVGTKDQGFNQLLFEAIRSGKWSSMLVHPLLSSMWGTPLFLHFPVALSIVGSEACGDLARKFEHYRLGGNPSASKTTRPEPLWLTVSFVRHAQSQGNIGNYSIIDPQLTKYGWEQAERLGALWSSTRIDKLYLSPTARTRQTTEKLLDGRADVETEERELLIEQDLGPEYTRLLVTGQIEAAGDLKTNGAPPGSRPVDIRRAYRTPGGESQNDLAKRAQLALLQIIFDHGVHLSTPPSPESWDGSLVDSIPHIVLVTHNLFLSELFESLLCWEQSSHTETIIEYGNTEWSRHLLRLDWPDDNFSLKSYRGSFFGLCLGNWYKMWSAF